MKSRLYILLMLIALSVLSCERDFNEKTDSNRSDVTFRLNCRTLFNNLLCYTDEGYDFCARDYLKGGENLLIRAYCYNQNDYLVASYVKTVPWQKGLYVDIHWDYLWSTVEYHSVFFAELVDGSDEEGYFESWFCMATEDWSRSYLYCDELSNDILRDALYKVETDFVPDHDTIELRFQPYTYNVYLECDNLGEADTLLTRFSSAGRVRLQSNTTTDYLQRYYSQDSKDPTPLMITMPYAEDTIWARFCTHTPEKRDTMYYYFWNRSHNSYVITIDAQDLNNYKMKDYYY